LTAHLFISTASKVVLFEQKNKTKKKPIMEKVVHILIGHCTKIIFFSETIVPIGTKPYRNIV
jgi:hypothetical protein